MEVPIIFNRKTKQVQRGRSAKIIDDHDVLLREINNRLLERLDEEINFKPESALFLGSKIDCPNNLAEFLVTTDFNSLMLSKSNMNNKTCCDEELLPFKMNSFDLVYSNLELHWTNDLPGTLFNINCLLKDRGVFLASIFGGATLKELRSSISQVDMDLKGGLAPRMSPSIDIKDMGMLLQRAGFKLPVVDSEIVTLLYKDVKSLIKDLRGMGETNALDKRAPFATTKTFLEQLETTYSKMFANPEGLIPASFEIITVTGWKS